jgi:hypothetical protein
MTILIHLTSICIKTSARLLSFCMFAPRLKYNWSRLWSLGMLASRNRLLRNNPVYLTPYRVYTYGCIPLFGKFEDGCGVEAYSGSQMRTIIRKRFDWMANYKARRGNWSSWWGAGRGNKSWTESDGNWLGWGWWLVSETCVIATEGQGMHKDTWARVSIVTNVWCHK